MTNDFNIIGDILFSQSLSEIRKKFESLRKDRFEPLDRIIVRQDVPDQYPYVDGVGAKLIDLQKIINQVDIANCFVLFITANKDISNEIDFVTRFYSIDPNPIAYLLVEGEYQKTVARYANTACKKLWNHLYVGTDGNVNPCCLADHRFPLGSVDTMDIDEIFKIHAQEIRSDMAQGLRHRACAGCYEKEDSGIRSARQICDPANQTLEIDDIDIRLNNICNFKCRMCSEYFSSAIQQETIELYGNNAVLGFEKISLRVPGKQVRNQRLEKILPLIGKNINSIYFAGGEPLLTGEHYAILDRLIDLDNTDLAIRYNTNLSTLSYRRCNVIDQWSRFSDVTVGASIDASGAVAEYMRHGTVWNDLVNNIHVIKKSTPHVKLQIASVVSCLTIENLIDLQTDWISSGLFDVDDFQVSVLTSPNFLSPAVLPSHHKHRLTDLIQKHIQCFSGTSLAKQWNDVVTWMNHNDFTFALKDFSQRTRVLDAHREESFEAVFPTYRDLL